MIAKFVLIALVSLASVGAVAQTEQPAAWKARMEEELAKQQAFLRGMEQQVEKMGNLRQRKVLDNLKPGRLRLKPMDINIPPEIPKQA